MTNINMIFSFLSPTVTGDTFLAMMWNTALYHIPVGTVFQLRDAPPHLSHHVCAFLDRKFPYHLMKREIYTDHLMKKEIHSLAPSFSQFYSSVALLLGVCNKALFVTKN